MNSYPPLIADTIPAFYEKIIIPFEHNKYTNDGNRNSITVKISDLNGNIKKTLSITNTKEKNDIEISVIELNGKGEEINNFLPELEKGNWYKFQLAYTSTSLEPSDYSSVALGRFMRATPKLTINNKSTTSRLNTNSLYQGAYDTNDLLEPCYSYQYFLYDNTDKEIEKSEELFVNSSVNSIQPFIPTKLNTQSLGYIQFSTKSANGYQMSIKIKLSSKITLDFGGAAEAVQDNWGLENGAIKITLTPTINDINQDGKYFIARERNGDTKILKLQEINFSSSTDTLIFYDFLIQSGNFYDYYLLLEKPEGVQLLKINKELIRTYVEPIYEHMFLSDNKRQLCIKFNPKISSFKNVIQESKYDTLDSQYPVFFRNGKLKYKEFPISGLISYETDENELFLEWKNDPRFIMLENKIKPTGLSAENYNNEREFRTEVLDWLNNGKPKLFRSPTEGNFVVRLMNVSLTPNDTLGRLLYTFNATAYECASADEESLQKLNLFFVKEVKGEVG